MIEKLTRFNWLAFAAMAALIAIGTLSIYSAGHAREAIFHDMWKANLWTAGFGLILYLLCAFSDYRTTLALTAIPSYAVSLILLVAVLAFGATVYGGRRWLWFFQPSEVTKLCVIMLLAFVYGGVSERGRRLRSFGGLALACLLLAMPAILILLEPDLGTVLALVPSALVMLLAARVWWRGLLVIIALIALAATFVLGAVYEAERPGVTAEKRESILKHVPLKPHQVKRVKVFLFPDEDLAGAGYNLRQSKISIATGGLRGKGIRKGERKRFISSERADFKNNELKYLPPSISMNDFIFCVWAEETGFIGSLVLLALFGVLLVACAWTALRAQDGCGRLLALGVATLIFAHVFINIAMSVGLVPITGLPLPFISSGRTFLVTAMAGLGLVQSVSIYGRNPTNRKEFT